MVRSTGQRATSTVSAAPTPAAGPTRPGVRGGPQRGAGSHPHRRFTHMPLVGRPDFAESRTIVVRWIKTLTKELKVMVLAHRSRLMDLPGVGPVVAARTLAEVGHVARFADRNRFASWTGTAAIEAPSGEIVRHRLSRAGSRRMNHMIHIAAATQIRLDSPGRAYYRRKLAAGKTRAEAMRCLKRRISDALYRQLLADAKALSAAGVNAGPGGHRGGHSNPARPAHTRTPALRISHFPDPHPRRYPRQHRRGRPRPRRPCSPRLLTTKGCR